MNKNFVKVLTGGDTYVIMESKNGTEVSYYGCST